MLLITLIILCQHHVNNCTEKFIVYYVQIQYKNPDVQIVTFKNMTPSPFITCFLEERQLFSFILSEKKVDCRILCIKG